MKPTLAPILRAACFGGASLLLVAASSMTNCAAAEPPAAAAQGDDAALKKFLHSTKDTYGWMPVKGTISYDFFPDGRLHIQGPDGEATMWSGKWTLAAGQLTLVNSDKKTKKTVKAEREGDDLVLDGQRYRRSRP